MDHQQISVLAKTIANRLKSSSNGPLFWHSNDHRVEMFYGATLPFEPIGWTWEGHDDLQDIADNNIYKTKKYAMEAAREIVKIHGKPAVDFSRLRMASSRSFKADGLPFYIEGWSKNWEVRILYTFHKSGKIDLEKTKAMETWWKPFKMVSLPTRQKAVEFFLQNFFSQDFDKTWIKDFEEVF